MSLFDDDSVSSSSSLCHDEDLRGVMDCTVNLPSTEKCHKSGIGRDVKLTREGVPSRFTLTEEENKQANERRRKEASSRSLLGGAVNADASSDTLRTGESRFHSSMLEALRMRKDAREALLLRRIRKQRQEEASSAELVEKDLDVGVFVTPQYLAAMKRQRNLAVGAAETSLPNDDVAGSEEASDPLEAYVRELEEKRSSAAGLSNVDSYRPETTLRAGGTKSKEAVELMTHATTQEELQSRGDRDGIQMEEEHSSKSKTALSSSTAVPVAEASSLPNERCMHAGGGGDSIGQVVPPSAAVCETARPEDVLTEARESRKCHRADRYVMMAAAERFNVRVLEGIEMI